MSSDNSTKEKKIAGNLFFTYLFQILGYVVGLSAPPYLTRTLSTDVFGAFMVASSFYGVMMLIFEFGLNTLGPRMVAQAGYQPQEVAKTVGLVQVTKITLIPVGMLVALLAWVVYPAFRQIPLLFISAVAFALFDGLSPIWYFFAQQKIRRLSFFKLICYSVIPALLFVFVKSDSDAWIIFGLQALGAFIFTAAATIWMYRDTHVVYPSRSEWLSFIKTTFSIFATRIAVHAQYNTNVLIYALFGTPAMVGRFGTAEHLVRAAQDVLQPLYQVIFPQISFEVSHNLEKAKRTAGKLFLGIFVFTTLASALIHWLAPTILPIYLGKEYIKAAPYAQMFAYLLPFFALNVVAGFQWMIPLGHESKFNRFVAIGFVTNIALAFLLAPKLQIVGMIVAIGVSEVLILSQIAWFLWRNNLLPVLWSKKGTLEA